MYRLFETDEFLKSLSSLQKRDGLFVKSKLNTYVYPQISNEPRFGINIKKLRGYQPETWRYRIGKYRVFYTIDDTDNLILLLVIESRDKAYRKN